MTASYSWPTIPLKVKMRPRDVATVLLLGYGATAFASDAIYLVCTLKVAQPLSKEMFYKVPPKSNREFVADAIRAGVLPITRVALPSAMSYVARPDVKRFEWPDGSLVIDAPVQITDAEIAVTGRSKQFTESYVLNRLTGELDEFVWLNQEAVKQWEEAHGKPLPSLLRWQSQCRKVERRF